MADARLIRSEAEEIVERANRYQSLFSHYFFNIDFLDPKLYHAVINIDQVSRDDVRLLGDDAQANTQQEAAQDQDEAPESGRDPGSEPRSFRSPSMARRPLTPLCPHLHLLRRADSQELQPTGQYRPYRERETEPSGSQAFVVGQHAMPDTVLDVRVPETRHVA